MRISMPPNPRPLIDQTTDYGLTVPIFYTSTNVSRTPIGMIPETDSLKLAPIGTYHDFVKPSPASMSGNGRSKSSRTRTS